MQKKHEICAAPDKQQLVWKNNDKSIVKQNHIFHVQLEAVAEIDIFLSKKLTRSHFIRVS